MRIKERLHRLMTDGRLNDRVPSENELARQHHVSRMTARKALNELLRDGLVERIPGKGTFVKNRHITQGYFHIHAFSENAKRYGVRARSQVVRAKIGRLPGPLIGKIPGKKAVCIRRVHFLDEQPVCYEIRYLRTDWCSALLNEDLESNSVHALIVDKLGLPITRVWQRLEAVSLRGVIAGALGTSADAPAFCMKQLIYSTDGPVSYVDYFLRSDVYAFEDSFESGKSFSGGWVGNGRFASGEESL
jgi:GntR family transcriptional regulator